MSNVNSATVSGNLTRDPDYKVLPSGTQLAELGIAVNRTRKDAQGELIEEASFFEVSVWGNFADLVKKKLRKGDRVTIQAHLEQQRWEVEVDGETKNRSKVVLVAEKIDSEGFFRSKDEDAALGGGEQAPAAAEAAPAAAADSPQGTLPTDDDIPF